VGPATTSQRDHRVPGRAQTDTGVAIAPQKMTRPARGGRLELGGGRAPTTGVIGSRTRPERRSPTGGDRGTVGLCASSRPSSSGRWRLTSGVREEAGYDSSARPIGRSGRAQRLADAYIDVEAVRSQVAGRLAACPPEGPARPRSQGQVRGPPTRVTGVSRKRVHRHGGVGIDTRPPADTAIRRRHAARVRSWRRRPPSCADRRRPGQGRGTVSEKTAPRQTTGRRPADPA